MVGEAERVHGTHDKKVPHHDRGQGSLGATAKLRSKSHAHTAATARMLSAAVRSNPVQKRSGHLKGRCAQVPPEMYDLFRRCKPYEGGNEPLWALNVTRGFTHAMLVPGVTTAFIGGMDIRGMGWISMPLKPVMDSKHEMELCTLAPQAAVQGKYQLAVYVAFGEVGSVAGKNVGEVLELFIKLVETIVNEIEAETRRLGFIK